MTWSVQSTDLRRRVREVLERVRLRHEPAIVQSYGRPQAVLIPYDDFEAYQVWLAQRAERAAWLAELRAIAEQVSSQAALTEADVDAFVNAAREGP